MFSAAMRRMALAAVVLGLMIGAARPAQADYVVNGGFETGDFTGWTLSGNPRADVVSFTPNTGNYSAIFAARGDLTFLSQDLTTTAGQSYALSFWLMSQGGGIGARAITIDAGPTNEFSVNVGGQTLLDEQNLPTFPYGQATFNFTATAPTTMLTFGFRNDSALFYLDDVAVNPTAGVGVPELDPGSMAGALTLMSGGVLVLTDRRRRRAVA